MPACVPMNNNNVSDVNANAKPPDQHVSKLSKIISCLFLKKKTDVVDMTKESSTASKKQKLSVDRSERSRRVLKMESMRTAPKTREESESQGHVTQSQNHMFLPSENPTASFLTYLNPSVRRACSEVIRTTSTKNGNRNVREAFTENGRTITTRNTNYRGQQPSENGVGKKGAKHSSKQPRPPERRESRDKRKPIVVPGIMSSSDDDIGYNSDNEISDLQDEMRRMNISQPDLRSMGANGKQGRRREGSITLSESSETDLDFKQEDDSDSDGPQNPALGETRDQPSTKENSCNNKKSMEEVIDNLFQQTQQNIDAIYKNGLEKMDLETYRSDTMTPETCMRRLEEELLKSQPDDQAIADDNSNAALNDTDKRSNSNPPQFQDDNLNNPHLDNLLTEVSIWAQDRQKWILDEKENLGQNSDITREGTIASMTTDNMVIETVSKSNENKCNEWVNEKSKFDGNRNAESNKANGSLTGPKLFRTPSRNDFIESNREKNKTPSSEKDLLSKLPTKRHYHGIQIVDIGQEENGSELKEVPGLDLIGPYPEPWTADMYTSTPQEDHIERSTINDNLSELDDKVPFRARSPDSWLSSAGSCSNMINVTNASHTDANEGFGPSPTPSHARKKAQTPLRITASDTAAQSHQILRQSPKIHAPFRGLDKQAPPLPVELNSIPTKPLLKNTQLKPLTVLRSVKPKSTADIFPTLPGLKHFNYQGMRNIHDDPSHHNLRPFSEIPLRPDLRNDDRNSSYLTHFSSVREPSNPRESYSNTQMSHSSSVREYRNQSYSFGKAVPRPVSETMPTKRLEKIGYGPIMATKENQHYARDVINAMEKHRLQPQQDAFKEPEAEVQQEKHQGSSAEQNEEKEAESGKEKHKVFTNSLIRGGYNYDKHSRKHNAEESKESVAKESANFVDNAKFSVKQSNKGMTSVTDLTFSIKDNIESQEPHRDTLKLPTEHHVLSTSTFKGGPNGVTLARGSTSQSFNIKSSQNTDLKRGNISKSFHNKYSATQSHGLGVASTSFDALNVNQAQTANKFRRNRREQEIEWLMKDAAETEV